MKKNIIVLLGLFMGGAVWSDEFYLHANMPPNSTPNDKTLWFDAPTGGTTLAALEKPAMGNRFNLNGFDLRAPGTSKSSLFNGTLVVGDAGAGICLLYATEWNLVGGVDINKSLLMRLHLPKVKISVSELKLGKFGQLTFRTLKDENNQLDLSVTNLVGSGTIQFGVTAYANDVKGVWNLSLPEKSSEFTGKIEVNRGQLTFVTAASLDRATLVVNPVEDKHVVLNEDVSFGNVLLGVRPLAAGTYTAAELNKLVGSDCFSGRKKLTIN